MNSDMEFTGLKFKKSEFKFKSKEEYNKYFNNALIESPFKFVRISNAEFDEKIHIALSWRETTKILSWILLGISILGFLANFGQVFVLATIGLGVISFVLSKIFKSKAEDLVIGKHFCMHMYEMNNFENLEEVRKDLIKESK